MRGVRRAAADERGFTLLEVLITIAISAIVLSTVTLAVAQGYSETSQSRSRLDRSNLADFAADIFVSDAASSATTQPGPTCGTGPTILDIAQSDGSWVSYAIPVSGGRYVLQRRVCDGVDDGAGDAAVRRLGSATAKTAPTTSGSICASGTGVRCTLAVTWTDGDGGGFRLSGTRRSG